MKTLARIFTSLILITSLISCSGIKKRKTINPSYIYGKWKLIKTVLNSKTNFFNEQNVIYIFSPSKTITTIYMNKKVSGKWHLKNNILTAYWPEYTEKQIIIELTINTMTMKNKKLKMISYFKKIR